MKTTIEQLNFPCEIKKKLKTKVSMGNLEIDFIDGHLIKFDKTNLSVQEPNQYKVLSYLKGNLNVFEFDLFLYDKDTIKVIDKDDAIAYFKYDKSIDDVLFIEENNEETYEMEL